MKAEKTAAEAIKKKTREIGKVARTFKFQDLGRLVDQLKALVEQGNKLPSANPYIDPDEYEYPIQRQSAYMQGDKSAAVIAKIEAEAPAYSCNCDPAKCPCATAEESVSQIKGLKCHFCDEEILLGSPVLVAETGIKMCPVCNRILWEKARLKESVAYAVINLCEDAATEADDPYFQFKESVKLVEEAQEQLQKFRQFQKAKLAR